MSFHSILTLFILLFGTSLWAVDPAKPPQQTDFALEKVRSLPLQVPDCNASLEEVEDVMVVGPDFFVFTAYANVPKAGLMDSKKGLFSWKQGALRTVFLDVKGFRVLYGDPFPEKSKLSLDRARIMVGGGLVHFTIASGFVQWTPDDLGSWVGGLYTWDGLNVRKVLAQEDSITLGGISRKVKSVNLQCLLPGGGYLVYLVMDKGSGIVRLKDGEATPLCLGNEPLPGFQNLVLQSIEKVHAGSDERDTLACTLLPKKGDPFLALLSPTKVTRILGMNEADPTDPASRVYALNRALWLDANRVVLHIRIYKGGKVDARRTKLILWEQGRFTLMHESETESRNNWREEVNEETVLGWWKIDGSVPGVFLFMRRRYDGERVGNGLRFYDGQRLHDLTPGDLQPCFFRMRRVPDLPDRPVSYLLLGRYGPVKSLYSLPPHRYTRLFFRNQTDSLKGDPTLVSSNGITFRLSEVQGGDFPSRRLLVVKPDGFYTSSPAPTHP